MKKTNKHTTNGKGKVGAPKGNRNALRHGLRCGMVPSKAKYVEHAVNALRRTLETALLELKGDVSISDAAAINSACKWEMHGQLSRYWLRHGIDKLSSMERLKFSEAIAKASDARDKAIRLLELDKTPETIDLKGYLEGNVK